MLIVIFDITIAELQLEVAIIINLLIIKATKDLHYLFFPRTIRAWNSLLKDVVESNCLETFKFKLAFYLTD